MAPPTSMGPPATAAIPTPAAVPMAPPLRTRCSFGLMPAQPTEEARNATISSRVRNDLMKTSLVKYVTSSSDPTTQCPLEQSVCRGPQIRRRLKENGALRISPAPRFAHERRLSPRFSQRDFSGCMRTDTAVKEKNCTTGKANCQKMGPRWSMAAERLLGREALKSYLQTGSRLPPRCMTSRLTGIPSGGRKARWRP
jgi:hypothetical protein